MNRTRARYFVDEDAPEEEQWDTALAVHVALNFNLLREVFRAAWREKGPGCIAFELEDLEDEGGPELIYVTAAEILAFPHKESRESAFLTILGCDPETDLCFSTQFPNGSGATGVMSEESAARYLAAAFASGDIEPPSMGMVQ